ncbi:hypothetical protein SMICM304S_05502 [Streptomyces microflavus]
MIKRDSSPRIKDMGTLRPGHGRHRAGRLALASLPSAPVTSGVNYDKKYFADKKLAPPQTFEDPAEAPRTRPTFSFYRVTRSVVLSPASASSPVSVCHPGR